MRIKGLIAVFVLAGLAFGATFFITDEWVEEKIEYQASVINKAKVEIDGFEFELFGLKMAWDRFQVANPDNPMSNTFETGPTEFDVQAWPLLLRNKVIIDNVKMTGFALNTERDSDGSFEVPVKEVGKEEDPGEPGFFEETTRQIGSQVAENANAEFMDVRDDINVDSLMALVDIRSIGKMDSLQQGLRQNYSKWESTISNNTLRTDVELMYDSLSSIDVEKLKDPEQLLKTVEMVKRATEKADSIKKGLVTWKEDLQQDLRASRASLSSIDNWIDEDIDRARNVAKLPEINAQNIGTALFGAKLLTDLNTYLEYLAVAREYGSRLSGPEEEKEEIARYEGRNYRFSDKYDLPGLWIKNIELSGTTQNDIDLSGQVTHLSSNQQLAGEPVRIMLSGEDENAVSLTVNGELNYLGEEPKESINVAYEGFTLSKARLSPSQLLPYELESGKGELVVSMDIIDRRINSEIDYRAHDISFDFAAAGAPKNKVESLIRTAISSTDEISATALVDNVNGPLRVRLRSNVDDLFLNTLRSTITAEVENAKRKIRSEVENRVNDKKQEVEQLVREKEAEVRAEYDRFEEQVNEQLAIIDKKKEELEKKKKELEDAAKDRVTDELKKLIDW